MALCVALLTSGTAWGQAGRYIPLPPVSSPAGGSGAGSLVYLLPSSIQDNILPVVVIGVGMFFLGAIGWAIGQSLTQGDRASAPPSFSRSPFSSWGPQARFVPPLEDLIRSPAEVQEKVGETTRLLGELARSDPAFDPGRLAVSFAHTFTQVQRCWQERDYGPIRDLLMPALRDRHEQLLRAMRRDGLINRIDDLLIRRLEFVHVCCEGDKGETTVTALITFDAKVYFVSAFTGAFVRGSQKVIPYQEFWTFRRDGGVWRLQTIAQSDEARPLAEPNRVRTGQRSVRPR
jgi:hypothetical protein